MDDKKLLKQVAAAKDELLKLRFQSATGQLEHPHKIKALRKEIARMLTQLNASALGVDSQGKVKKETANDK